MKQLGKIDECIVFGGSTEGLNANVHYQNNAKFYYNDADVYYEDYYVNINIIKELMAFQKASSCKKVMVIFDNCRLIGENNNKVMKNFFLNANQNNISYIITSQYPYNISIIRPNKMV